MLILLQILFRIFYTSIGLRILYIKNHFFSWE